MKNLFRKKSIVWLCLISLVTFSCQKNEDFVEENELESSVINTFKTNLKNGIDSIQLITKTHAFFKDAAVSGYIDSNTLETCSPAIYFYSNKTKALLMENISGNVVYIYMMDANNNFKEAYLTYLNKNKKTTLKAGEPILQIESLVSKELVYSYELQPTLKGWGKCMDDAIDRLYDDWEEDPAGTAVCWLTGPLCVVGGGIACGILQI